jgi:hypothetical protein
MEKYGKKIIASYDKYLDNERFEVIVVDDNDYYNIHVISEKYRDDELNTMKLQEPKDCIKDIKYFDNAKLISYLMDHFIWDRFYDNGIFCGYTTIKFDSH